MIRTLVWRGIFGLASIVSTSALAQEPFARSSPRAGAIVSAKGGEELQIRRDRNWRPAVVRQDVVGGDTLRTGEIGTLGITFADQTTIRIGRQSTLLVNDIAGTTGSTELTLPAGSVWARASRGGTGVTVKTPAASAAIRGTDWSLSVQGDRTSLIVLEGVVDFSNPQGSVTVRQGEAATARIGEKPTKIVLVRPDDREQMLFYLELRGLFRSLPATALDGAARRRQRARLAAIPPERRSVEDWVSIAENGFGQDMPALVRQAVSEARRRNPTPRQSGRLDLVEALLAGSAKRYGDAARLFARAAGTTGGRQRASAQCGFYAAAVLANPKRRLPAPRAGDADRSICAAYVTGFAKGLEDAEAILAQSTKAHPDHLLSALLQAQVSLLLNRRDAMRAIVERMRASDPDSPETLLASGYLKSSIDSDLDGAVADFSRGVAIAPGDSEMWNGLGLAQDSRDAPVEAEAAFRRAIEADPYDPVAYSNLAILLLDQSRVEEAGVLIDKSLELDPSFYAGYTAKGRYLLQRGESARAMEFLLAGSAANPASAQGLLAVAIAQYQSGDLEVAGQALDNADRLDANDPVTSIARTAIALDQFRADEAITNAREAVRRYRNRGGYFAALASTRTGGSYLGQAYRFLGLEEWGRFYTERVADPFSSTSYFDQAAARRTRPLFTRPTVDQLEGADFADSAASLVIQGLLLDPLAASGRIGRIDLLRRPFIDIEFGGSLVRSNGRTGWKQDVSVQAFGNEPIPTSVSLSAGQVNTQNGRGAAGGELSRTASAFIGMQPNAAERFLFWGTASSAKPDLLTPAISVFDADASKVRSGQLGAGWSHTFGYRNVLSTALVATRADQTQRRTQIVNGLDPIFFLFPATYDGRQRQDTSVDSLTAAISHSYGYRELTFRSGAEYQTGLIRGFNANALTVTIPAIPVVLPNQALNRVRGSFQAGRAYANLQWQPSDMLQVEGGVEAISLNTTGAPFRTFADPRIGLAFAPMPGQWLRASWRRDTQLPNSFTLAPVTTVGLAPNELPVQLGGRRETASLRWDAEWTPHFFTAVEYQHQKARNLRIAIPDTLDTFDLERARLDIVTATANVWLTHGVGLFGTIGAADSRAIDAAGGIREVPFVPHRFARAGLTFAHPSRLKLSVIENFIGARQDAPAGRRLSPLFTTDITATYETPDRRFQFGFSVLNLLDRRYDFVAPTAGSTAIPGAGRTISGSLRVRF